MADSLCSPHWTRAEIHEMILSTFVAHLSFVFDLANSFWPPDDSRRPGQSGKTPEAAQLREKITQALIKCKVGHQVCGWLRESCAK